MQPFEFNETWIHKVNPSFKLLASVVLFMVVLLSDNINVLLNLTVASAILLYAFSGHPAKRMALLSLPFILLFVSSASSMTLFGKGETVWLDWGLVRISKESFVRGLHIGLKTINISCFGLMFGLTTRPVYLFYSLMQQLRMPPRYAYSFMAAIRLIPMMADEFRTLRQALKVRGIAARKGLPGVYDNMKRYSIPLLAQSIRRAQRIAVAMEAKRFTGNGARTYYYAIGWSASDFWFAAYWLAMAAAAVYAGTHYPYIGISDVSG